MAFRKLYLAAGDNKAADGVIKQAQRKYTAYSLGFVSLLGLLIVAGLVGCVVLTYYVVNRRGIQRQTEGLAVLCEGIPHPVLWLSFLAYIVAFMGVSILMSLLVGPLIQKAVYEEPLLYMLGIQFATSVLSGSAGLATLAYLTKISGGELCSVGLTLRDFWKNVGWGVAGYTAVLPVLLFAAIISSLIFRGAGAEHPIGPMLISGGLFSRLIIFLLASVLAPFFEEIFFRGLLYGALRAKLKFTAAVLASAFLFAIIHPQLPAGFLPIFGIGAVFAILAESRRSLVPSMVAHCLNNTVVLLLTILAFGN